MSRLYIAGPMTGYPDYNFPAFNEVSTFLTLFKGHEIYNPATSFGGRQDLPYDTYLRHAIQMVTMVEGIVLLPGWNRSKGALTESHVGLSIGLQFFTVDLSETQPDIRPFPMSYELLIQEMGAKLRADTGSVSEGVDRDSREAEGRQDNAGTSPSGPAPGLDAESVRGAFKAGLRDHGSGHGGPLPEQRPQGLARHRPLFPWNRPRVVGEPAYSERAAGL